MRRFGGCGSGVLIEVRDEPRPDRAPTEQIAGGAAVDRVVQSDEATEISEVSRSVLRSDGSGRDADAAADRGITASPDDG